MSAHKPEEIHRLFAEAANVADVETALALYELDPAFAGEPGEVRTGTKAIRQHLSDFFAMKPTFTKIETTKVFQASDIALLYSDWAARATDPDGEEVDMSGRGNEVVRRQNDGTWRIVIDNPFG